MPETAISTAIASHDQLGEGPCWDDRLDTLLRVDISNGLVHGWAPETGSAWSRRFDGEVSAAIPRAHAEGLLVAAGHRLLIADRQRADVLASAEERLPDNRFNDCKCDPQGRLWAGTMSKTRAPGTAALYRLVPGEALERVVAGTTISNGLGWNPAGDLMYFIDSTTQRIDVFDFDGRTGSISDRRPFAEIDPADGLPDGLTVDAAGGVWVCLFGGAALRRYDERGKLDGAYRLPVTNPTSTCFGGAGLGTLYVTSARHRLSEAQLAAEPLAGALLALEPGVAGLPGNRFAG
jgi:sugar lactone lactonase YvrE